MTNLDFSEKTILVTGVSRGIGKGIAELLAGAGASVVGTYNTGAEEAKDLHARYPNIKVEHVDLSLRDETYRLVDRLADVPFDGLVNNAGIIEFEAFPEFTMQAWDRTFEVNLSAIMLLSQKLGLAMRPGSAIVNVASTDAFIGTFSSIAYSASKAALISITKSLANVLGARQVRVNAVAPGWIDTGMSTDASYEAASLTPLSRNGRVEEVAMVVAFLLSDNAAYMTGSTVVVDGGYTCVDYIMKKENDAVAG